MSTETTAASTFIQRQRDLLFARLDLEGEGANLQPADPLVPATEVGAAEVWAYQASEPELYFAFYLFASGAPTNSHQQAIAEANQARIPSDAVYDSVITGAILVTGYHFPADPDDFFDPASVAFYEVFGRVGGEE